MQAAGHPRWMWKILATMLSLGRCEPEPHWRRRELWLCQMQEGSMLEPKSEIPVGEPNFRPVSAKCSEMNYLSGVFYGLTKST